MSFLRLVRDIIQDAFSLERALLGRHPDIRH